MNYTTDPINCNEMDAAAAAFRDASFYVEAPVKYTHCTKLYNIIAFDAETKTGLCQSVHTQIILAFRVRASRPCSGMRNVTMFGLRDISLEAGILLAKERVLEMNARCSDLLDLCPVSVAQAIAV